MKIEDTTVKDKLCHCLIEKIYKDKADLILDFAEYIKLGKPLFTKFDELNKELKLLSIIETYQVHCYEPLHKIENFNEAYRDGFEGWDLIAKDKEIDLYKIGLLGADELKFKYEDIRFDTTNYA